MIADTHWLIDNKVIHARPKGNFTIQELLLISETYQAFIDESDAPLVHVLVDQSELGSIPILLNTLTKALEFFRHPRLGWFIIYGNDDQMKKFLSSILTGITKVRHRRFSTLEESLQFLATMDTTLPTVQEMQDSMSL